MTNRWPSSEIDKPLTNGLTLLGLRDYLNLLVIGLIFNGHYDRKMVARGEAVLIPLPKFVEEFGTWLLLQEQVAGPGV